MKIAEQLALEKMTNEERAYCQSALTEKEYYQRFIEVVENRKDIIYNTYSDISQYIEENASKNRDKYSNQFELLNKMEKIMPLSQAQSYLDIPFSFLLWQKIIKYIDCIDNSEKISEDILDVIIALLKLNSAGKKADEGFYFLIKNMIRSLSMHERKYCMSVPTISDFIKRVYECRSGNITVFQNSVIECFDSMIEKFGIYTNFTQSDEKIVLQIAEQINQQGISHQADGLGGVWTVLQNEKTVQLIVQKLNQPKL
ncbi:MAG: hypothetical protein NC218_04305 [Acetobacter sp.]|nr:hypothetical protein [Acetobacter sp.]